jgi:hypothetical protein
MKTVAGDVLWLDGRSWPWSFRTWPGSNCHDLGLRRCPKPRNITEDQLIKGASIIGAAKVVEEIANGAQNVIFA